MNKPHIAIDTSPLESGHKGRGVGTYTRELVKALKVANKNTPRHKAYPSLEGYDRQDFSFSFTSQPKQVQADLIHYPYFDLFFQTLPILKPSKTVVTIHDVIPLKYPEHFPVGVKGRLRLQLQKLSLQSVDHIITDSQASAQDIETILHIPQRKITPVLLAASNNFQPVSSTQSKSVKKKYQLPQKYLLFVGSVTYNKNLPRLIKAVAQLQDIPLVIVTRTNLQSKVAEKQTRMILDAVNQALNQAEGWVQIVNVESGEDLNKLYSGAYAYIQASLAEGFGLPVLEAMQSGTLVWASHATSLPEVAGEAALYFDPQCTDSISQTIQKGLRLSQSKRQQLISAGLKRAEKLSWEKTAAETIKVYRSILQS